MTEWMDLPQEFKAGLTFKISTLQMFKSDVIKFRKWHDGFSNIGGNFLFRKHRVNTLFNVKY